MLHNPVFTDQELETLRELKAFAEDKVRVTDDQVLEAVEDNWKKLCKKPILVWEVCKFTFSARPEIAEIGVAKFCPEVSSSVERIIGLECLTERKRQARELVQSHMMRAPSYFQAIATPALIWHCLRLHDPRLAQFIENDIRRALVSRAVQS